MVARNALEIEDGMLLVVPRGFDKIWGFRGHIAVPLSSIVAVAVESVPFRIAPGWRGPGLDVFGRLVGTFHPAGERHYWNYSGTGAALSIRVDETQKFRQLFLSVDDAESARQMLSEAIEAQPAKQPILPDVISAPSGSVGSTS